jgi:hypothetical protein
MTRILSQFTISRSGDDYVLHIEDEDGDLQDYAATFEQLDLITEAIDEQLNTDEEDILGIDEGEEEVEQDEDEDEDKEE